MIYTNEWSELEEIVPVYNELKSEGLEIAFATDVIAIAKFLSINKMLVVKYGTYFPDIIISNTPLKGEKVIKIKDVRDLL